MFKKWIIAACALMVLLTASTSAQTVEIDGPNQLTFLPANNNYLHSVATNGSEWGILYTRYEHTTKIFFMLVTYDGEVFENHALFEGEHGTFGYQQPRLTAYPGGWALTYEYRDSGSEAPDRYFAVLDKNGRRTGASTLLHEEEFVGYIAPIWTGDMFIVFYYKWDESFHRGIWVAYFNEKGKRIRSDKLVIQPEETSFDFDIVVPTSMGFAIFGGDEIEDEVVRPFYLLVGLDGEVITGPKYLDKKITPYGALNAIWKDDGFVLAGAEYPVDAPVSSRPAVRLLSKKARWQGGPFRHTASGEDIMQGVGYDGQAYFSVAINSSNAGVFGQQLDDKLKPVGMPLFLDDSAFTSYFSNKVASVGSDVFYFASNKKTGFSSSAVNIYYTHIMFPHTGKPDITFFNGEAHEFNGQTYALLDWHVAGSRTVEIKTKGARWTLPASGFFVAKIKGKSRFKIIAANDAGKSKTKIKIKP